MIAGNPVTCDPEVHAGVRAVRYTIVITVLRYTVSYERG
jgi:hypothetical protein